MRLSLIARYWHTLRHLRPVQFYGRLWFRLSRPQADLSSAPSLRMRSAASQPPARRGPSMIGPKEFRFLNEEDGLARGWDDVESAKLWRYNLHYFDDLNAENAASRDAWHVTLMDDWIHHNPAGAGTGWEPYPTSLRIVNWIKRHLDGRPMSAEQCQCLAVQVRWLTQKLEWHLLGNHLFANAKALVLAGLMFDGAEADRWLAKGLTILRQELAEQVLPDGGNFERSPMYHAIFLEDLLDLLNAAQTYGGRIDAATVGRWRETASRMGCWMTALCHPDGEISLFNDAAIGIAPSPAELTAYGARLGVVAPAASAGAAVAVLAVTVLRDSGYIRVEHEAMVALLDVAAVGPDYLPGHAHADTLSFELSVFGQRVVVNGGTSRYGLGPVRLRERGTAAHSTVEVAGQNSSEVWGGFRVARRAYPFDLQVQQDAVHVQVACSHDGYMRLHGKPVHRRVWTMGESKLEVMDTVLGGIHPAVARYIIHPDIVIKSAAADTWALTLSGGQAVHICVLTGEANLEPACYAPEFGVVLPTQCLAVNLIAGKAQVEWTWS